MKSGELLAKVTGLSRKDLEWWENAGYVRPQLVQRGRLMRRVYSESDFELISAMWNHRSRGMTPKAAYLLALRDLGREHEVRAPPCRRFDQLYKAHRDEVDSFLEQVFQGQELSLEQICLRAREVLQTPGYRKNLRELMSHLPIEEVSPGLYRYQTK